MLFTFRPPSDRFSDERRSLLPLTLKTERPPNASASVRVRENSRKTCRLYERLHARRRSRCRFNARERKFLYAVKTRALPRENSRVASAAASLCVYVCASAVDHVRQVIQRDDGAGSERDERARCVAMRWAKWSAGRAELCIQARLGRRTSAR